MGVLIENINKIRKARKDRKKILPYILILGIGISMGSLGETVLLIGILISIIIIGKEVGKISKLWIEWKKESIRVTSVKVLRSTSSI